jgi:hypothetical protein
MKREVLAIRFEDGSGETVAISERDLVSESVG